MGNSKKIVILDNHSRYGHTLTYFGYVYCAGEIFDGLDCDVESKLDDYGINNEDWNQVIQAIQTGVGTAADGKNYDKEMVSFAIEYCSSIEEDDYMTDLIKRAVARTGNLDWALACCRNLILKDHFRQVIIDSGNVDYAYRYLRHVNPTDEQIRDIVLSSNNINIITKFRKYESFFA